MSAPPGKKEVLEETRIIKKTTDDDDILIERWLIFYRIEQFNRQNLPQLSRVPIDGAGIC